jgi:F-box protein 11
MNRGNFVTISEAICAVQPGTRILVRPGTYRENLVIDKTLEIVGEGKTEDIVVQSAGSTAIQFGAPMGRVANLTVRQMDGGKYFAVNIISGRLDLEDCDISSQSLSAVGIHGGADPRLRRNRVHSSKEHGIFVYDNGAGVIEDNDIFGNSFANVLTMTGANPTVRRNRIRDGKVSGIRIDGSGGGVIEDNDIFGNGYSGIQIQTGANPTVRRNRIHDGKTTGIFIFAGGAGLIEDNDIVGNAYSGIEVKSGSNPTVCKNRIKGNREGVRVLEGGTGTFEGNEFSDNKTAAWLIAPDCEASVKRSDNTES